MSIHAVVGPSPYRRIDVSGFSARFAPPEEEPPRLFWLPVDSLVIDDRYQRPVAGEIVHAILRIAERFTWRHFSPCLVADQGDGSFALIDGQCRTHAAALNGHAAVPCLVVALAPVAQASAFAAVNGETTRLHPAQVFRAALAAGEVWAVRADRAVAEGGGRLMTVKPGLSPSCPGDVFAVTLVRSLVEAGQDGVVTRGLAAVAADPRGREAWWPLWATDHLRPWLMAVSNVPEAGRLDAFHRDLDVDRIARGAERMQAQPGYAGRSKASIMADLLIAMLQAWARKGGRA